LVARADNITIRSLRLRRERGYVLLTLLLAASLLVIAAAVVAPAIAFQIKRDREEELIHRGIQYRRAIRSFVKHNGRFPQRLEELENTNNTRYLRKQYKDPITGRQFRLLHGVDIAAFSAGFNAAPGMPQGANVNTGFASQSPAPEANAADTATIQNMQTQSNGVAAQAPASANSEAVGGTIGGGPIFGVASWSEKKTIREFDHKGKYNQWLFFFSNSTAYDGRYEVMGPTPLSSLFPAQKSAEDPSGQPASPSSAQLSQ
jgi:type II secretory pathway pseudopilin PulG